MKKLIRMTLMAAAMFMAVTTVAQAQGGGRRGRGPDLMTILKDSIKVSDAVAAKADSIIKATAEKRTPLMEAARGGDADARTKMFQLQTEQNDAIKALLTDDQKAQFEKLVPQRGRRGGGGL